MKRETKHFFAGLYFIISLLALCGKPSNEDHELIYAFIVVANLGFAAFLVNRYSQKKNDPSADGNRLPQRPH